MTTIAPAQKNKLAFVDLDKIHWEKRFRTDLGDIASLAESIKDKGVLQPITVTPDFELMAGERRVTAAKAAGLTQIPALIRRKEDIIDAREVELLENTMRLDFSWDEQADLMLELDTLCKAKKSDWSGRKTAQLMNLSVANVARNLKLAKAMTVIPELRQMKTADDALKTVAKLEETAIVGELRHRQQEAVTSGVGLQRGIAEMLKIADANYEIGDTFKCLARFRSNGKVDIIECDPPYGINLTELKQQEGASASVKTYEEIPANTYPEFLKRLTKELFRVAGENCWMIFWFGPTWQHEVLTNLREAGWQVDEIPAIWAKPQGQTMQPEINLARSYEPFYLCRKGRPILVKRGHLNVFSYSGATKKYHPTERPVALIQELLEMLIAGRGVVLVPFLGSGATLRAAYNLGLSAAGFELNPEYKDKFMLAIEEDARHLNNEPDTEKE